MLITEDKYFIFDKSRNENFVYKTNSVCYFSISLIIHHVQL